MKLEIWLLDRHVIDIDTEIKPTTTLKEIIDLIKNRTKPFSAIFDEENLQINNRVFTINDFSKPLNELNINTDTIKFAIKKRTIACILFYLACEIKNAKPNLDPNSNPTPKTLSLVARQHLQNPWPIADLWEMLNYLNKVRKNNLAYSSKIDILYHFLKLLYLTAPIARFEPNIPHGDPKELRKELYSASPNLQRIQTLLSQFNNLLINHYFFSAHSASLFFQALKTNKTIKNLDFYWDSRYKNWENEFCEFLKNNTSLLQLYFNCDDNDILHIVAEGLKKNRTLQALCLSGIKNKSDAAKILAVDSPLQSLIFNFWLLEKDKDAVQEIAKALQSNASLRSITIKMHFDYLPLIASALQKNTVLTEITLPATHINIDKLEEAKNTLTKISENNSTLKIIIDCNYHNGLYLINKNLEAKMNFHKEARKLYAQRCIEILSTEPKTLSPILKMSSYLEFKEKEMEIKLSLLNDFVIAFYKLKVTQFITLKNIMNLIKKSAGSFSAFLNGASIQVNDQIFTDPNFSKSLFELNIEKIDTINIKIKKSTGSCILYSLIRELSAIKPDSRPDSNLIPKTLFLVANRQREENNPWSTSELWNMRHSLNKMRGKNPEISSQINALYNFLRLLFLNAPIVKCPDHDAALNFPGNLRDALNRPHSSLEVIKTILSQYNTLIIHEASLPPKTASLFFEALKTNNTIKSLDFTWNSSLKESANAFCKALQGNTGLLELKFACTNWHGNSKYDNNDDMLQIIAEGLKNNTSLRELIISKIKNKNEAAKIVAINSSSLTSLSLFFEEGDKIATQDVSKLSEALQNNTSLRSLDINIHVDYLPDLMTALQKNIMLTEITPFMEFSDFDVNTFDKINNTLVEIIEKNTTSKIKLTCGIMVNSIANELNQKMNFNAESRKIYTENCIDTLLTQPEKLPTILKIPGHFEFKKVPKSALLEIMLECPLLIAPLCQIIMDYLPPFPFFTLTSAPQQFFAPQNNVKRKHSSLDDKNDHSDPIVIKKINTFR